MRTLALLLGLLLFASLAPSARAEGRLVVVELFTSQGCSACPPADRLLGQLAETEGVIALSLHVDYWDYLGWVDRFGSAEHTSRQKAYARRAGRRTIFTPEVVVMGVDSLVGHKGEAIVDRISAHAETAAPIELVASRTGSDVEIVVAPGERYLGVADVLVVRYRPSATVEVERGENAGRTLTYHNVVTGWERVGRWDGEASAVYRVASPDATPAAVLIQSPDEGAILAAAAVR